MNEYQQKIEALQEAHAKHKRLAKKAIELRDEADEAAKAVRDQNSIVNQLEAELLDLIGGTTVHAFRRGILHG